MCDPVCPEGVSRAGHGSAKDRGHLRAHAFTEGPARGGQVRDERCAGFSRGDPSHSEDCHKLARGHVAYEQNEPQLDEPISVAFVPFTALDPRQRTHFFPDTASSDPDQKSKTVRVAGWSEVGSRALTREVHTFAGGTHSDVVDGWVVVQSGNYRYRTEWGGRSRVQMVLREYLAAEVVWDSFPNVR
jgi:hypothetical protein